MHITIEHSRLPFVRDTVREGSKPTRSHPWTRSVDAAAKVIDKDLGFDDTALAAQQVAVAATNNPTLGAAGGLLVTSAFLPLVMAGGVAAVREFHKEATVVRPQARHALVAAGANLTEMIERDAVDAQGGARDDTLMGAAELERAADADKMASHERNEAGLVAVGMPLLATGLAVSGAKTAVELAVSVGLPAATAANALGVASGGLLIPAQLALGSAGAYKAVTGLRRDKQLVAEKRALAHLNDMLPREQMDVLLGQNAIERRHNRRSRTVAGAATAVGQGLMVGGSAATITGAGAVAGVPLLAAGAVTSIGATALQQRADKVHGNATGAKASTSERTAAELAADNLVKEVAARGLRAGVQSVSRDHERHCEAVAYGKLLSLVVRMLRQEPEGERVAAYNRRLALKAMLYHTKGGALPHSSLLKEDILRMRRILEDDPTFRLDFFKGERHEVERRVVAAMELTGRLTSLDEDVAFHERIMRKATRLAVKESQSTPNPELRAFLSTAQGTRRIDVDEWHEFRLRNDGLNQAFHAVLAKDGSRQIKADGKFGRTQDAQSMVDIAHALRRQPLLDEAVRARRLWPAPSTYDENRFPSEIEPLLPGRDAGHEVTYL